MRSHISVYRGTIKFRSNSLVFKNEIEKEGLPRDTAPALGARGSRFKSGRPDQNISRVFFSLLKAPFTPIDHRSNRNRCLIRNDRGRSGKATQA
jgi:hypothetical protein